MDWGMQNRISKLIKPETGRAVWLAIDHGYFLGAVSKLEKPQETVRPLLGFADALMLTRGVLRNCIDAKTSPPVILRVSGGNSIVGEDLSKEAITTSIKEAVRLNVSACAFSIYVGAKYEHQTLLGLANLINEAQEYGIPVLAVTAVGKELAKRDARYLSLACRIAAELGAQIIKTYYCDDFHKVVEASPVPLVIAGGPKLRTELDALQLASDAVGQGAAGVDMGRNIWQSDNSVAMIQAIRQIVHKNASVSQAEELFNSLKK
ncbi:MAG: 3-hydroxy-5-phosphonooxypentane-2,4-dione thiolase [Candidatus Omnitrophota bacterium]|nr:MAG: 3-hydroxy-5-phosphonooxypentane-2,4-dione thiolase [Candidatus Omnitrophota bacterium]